MLRNRSRAVTTKQASLMADQQSSPTQICHYAKPTSTISSFFHSPRFKPFISKIAPFESDFTLISPTSILDTNPSIVSCKTNKPISYFEPTNPKSPRFHSPEASGGIGLADLVNTVIGDGNRDSNGKKVNNSTKPINKMVLFGSKLRVQIPSLRQNNPPADFGTKTGGWRNPGQGQDNSGVQTRVLTGCLSVREMEMSEDYTCVISHGPNPTTTHIFENCVFVENYCSLSSSQPVDKDDAKNKTNKNNNSNSAKMDNNFLSFCYTCKKSLDQKHDIYIYRGEKAFCSSECRYQEMLIDQIES